MNERIEIGDRAIGPEEPLFIIAECGVTCNYDLEITKELIDVVAQSGADAIKLIFFFPDELMSDRSATYTYQTMDGERTENMYEMFSEMQFSLQEWEEIAAYAEEKGVMLFSSIHSPSGVEWTEKLDLPAYKMSSWDFNHHPLWRQVARTGKPILIDTGPVFIEDVAKVMKILREEGNEQAAFVHCYHADDPAEFNMRSIPYLNSVFGTPVGFSAKNRNDDMDAIAVALGASILEKRLTIDRSLPQHHHAISKNPEEFEEWVNRMRDAKASLGRPGLHPSEADLESRKKYFRRIVADQKIEAGTVLTEDMLEGKRPADGISPEHMEQFLGRELKRSLEYNDPLEWDDV